jgi:hypothetical protein
VQGVVTHFVRGDSIGHTPESFEVDGHQYSFRKSVETEGYNGHPGGKDAIYDGARVRIADVNGLIARLEIETQ